MTQKKRMSTEARIIRVEEKLDDLAVQLREYHDDLLRNYYTKTEVDARLAPLAGMLNGIATLKEASRRHNDAAWLSGAKSSATREWMAKHWSQVLNIILLLVLIIAGLLNIKLP